MGRKLNSLILAGLLGSTLSLSAADLTVDYVQPAAASIDWDGFGDMNGNGSVVFASEGDVKTASLSVLCNSPNGYRVFFNSSNATGVTTANLVNGAYTMGYSASLNTSGINNATIVTNSLVLNNPSTASLDVNFNGGGDVLPLIGATQANVIELQVTLDAFNGQLKPAGTYLDVITATIALN